MRLRKSFNVLVLLIVIILSFKVVSVKAEINTDKSKAFSVTSVDNKKFTDKLLVKVGDNYLTDKTKQGWVVDANGSYYYLDGFIDDDTKYIYSTYKEGSYEIPSGSGNFYYFKDYKLQIDYKVKLTSTNFRTYFIITDGDGCIIKDGSVNLNGSNYFIKDSKIKVGVVIDSKGKPYLSDDNGVLVQKNGWTKADFSWFYIENGVLVNGLKTIGGKPYCFINYTMVNSQSFNYEGKEYFANSDGVLLSKGWCKIVSGDYTGWMYIENGMIFRNVVKTIGGKQYAFADTGISYCNREYEVNGKTYYSDSDSALIKNGLFYDNFYTRYRIIENGVPKKAGWKKLGNYWYYAENEILLKDCQKSISNKYYAFNQKAQMADNSWLNLKSNSSYYWVYASKGGALYRNQWLSYNNKWYYFDNYNTMCCNDKVHIGNNTYYFGKDGSMVTKVGWINLGSGDWCYVSGKSGKLLENKWIKSNGEWYYFNVFGNMARESIEKDSTGSYHILDNGKIDKKVGWQKFSSKQVSYDRNSFWFYINSGGKLAERQWVKSNGYWYYFQEPKGYLEDCIKYIGSSYYAFDKEGRMIVNKWISKQQNGKTIWYYFGSDGKSYNKKWLLYKNNWYYFDDNEMCTTALFGSSTNNYYTNSAYFFNKDGIMQKNKWWKYEGSWYYLGEDGKAYSKRLATIGGKTYYFRQDCRMLVGLGNFAMSDGKKYYFAKDNGELYKNTWVKDGDFWYYAKGNYTLAVNETYNGYRFSSTGFLIN